MTFVFDTLHFRAESGGPARVTEELIKALREAGETVFTNGPERPAPSAVRYGLNLLRRIAGMATSYSPSAAGETVQVAGEIWPIAIPGATNIIIVHDTFALDSPEWAKPVERILQNRRIKWAESHANLVIVPSEEVKVRLTRVHPHLGARIAVVPWGVAPEFVRVAPTPVTEVPYWVASGDTTPRKGLNDLLDWYKTSGRPKLLLTGNMRRGSLPANVETTGRLSVPELARTIADADLYLSFSRDEGYGLAIAEAAATGVPVVARTFPGGEARFPAGITWFDEISGADNAVAAALSGSRSCPDWVRERTWQKSAIRLREAVRLIQR